MSGLNLGTEATQAAQELRGNPHFDKLLAALEAKAYEFMSRSLDATPEQRLDNTGYARAVRDLWVALVAANTAVHQRAVRQPRLKLNGDVEARDII